MKTVAIIGKIIIIVLMVNYTLDSSSTPDMPRTPGIHDQILMLGNGLALRYGLALPTSYSTEKPIPLVLTLHYGGPVTPHYGRDFLSILPEPALRELQAVMVAPDCPGNGWTDPISEEAVIALVRYIQKNYKIDTQKCLVTGFSLGAIGTWHLAAGYPDIFSAAVPISGITDEQTLSKIQGIPVYVIHSRRDEIFPIRRVEKIVDFLKENGQPIRFKAEEGISHYHTGRFAAALKEAVPWIKGIWEKQK